MIFKTFDSDIDKWTSKIGILGKSFNSIFEAKNQRKIDIDDLVFYQGVPLSKARKQVGNLWGYLFPKKEDIQNQLIDINKLIPQIDISNATEITEKIKKISESVAKGEITWQKLFDILPDGEKHFAKLGQQMEGQIITTEGVIKANQQARASALAHNEAIKAQSFSAKAGKVALQALAMAGNMLAMWAITKGLELAVKGIDNLVHSAEHCKERVDELMSSYQSALDEANSNAKTVEELASRYEELSHGVNNLGENVSLATDEYAEYNKIVNQIADMFPTLVQGYTNEGNAILSLKGNVEQLRDAYKEAQQEAYNLLIASGQDSDGNDIIKNWENLHNTDFFSKTFDLGGADVGGDISVSEALEQLKALSEMSAETYRNIEKVTGSGSREQIAALSEVEKLIGYGSYIPTTFGIDMTVSDKDFEVARKQAKVLVQTYQAEIDSALKNVQTLANAYLMTNEDYAKLDDQSKAAASIIVNSINEGIASGFQDKEDVGEYVIGIVDTIKDNPEVQDALVGLFSLDLSDMPVNEAKELVDLYIKSIAKAIGEDELELRVRLGFDDTIDTANKLKNSLLQLTKNEDYAVQYMYDDMLSDFTKDFTAEQVELWLEATRGVENATEAIELYKAKLAEINADADNISLSSMLTTSEESLDKFQASVKSVADAYATLLSGNYSSTELLDSIQAINKAVSEMGESIEWEGIGSLEELGSEIETVSNKYAESILSGAGIDTDSEFGRMLADCVIQSQKASTQLDVLNTQIDSMQSAYKNLTDVIDTYNEHGYITFDQLQNLLAMEPQYLACLIDENGQLQLNQQALQNLAEMRLYDAKVQAVNQAISELGMLTFYDEKKAIEENAQAFSGSVEHISAYNAELANTIAEAGLAAPLIRDLNAALNGAEERGASDVDIQTVLDNLNAKMKLIGSMGKGAISNMFGGFSSSASSAAKSASKEASDSAKEALDNYMDAQEKALDAGKISFKEYCDNVSSYIQDAFDNGKISAKEFWDYQGKFLEKQKSVYDKAINAVVRKIDDELDGLKDKQDEIDKFYDSQISSLEQTKKLLQETNDERKRQADLQKALYEMERAYNQRTKLVNYMPDTIVI